MYATLWDRFTEDPLGFLTLGLAVAAVVVVTERVFRVLLRRREREEGRHRHRIANELPRAFEAGGRATVLTLADDLEEGEVEKR